MQAHLIPQRLAQVVWTELDHEAVVLNLTTGAYYTLNEVGCAAWQLIDATRNIRAIADELTQTYDADAAQIESDLLALMAELHAEQLILLHETAPAAGLQE